MPEALDEGVIYVSLRFSLVSHRCACGCGEEVVTPLSPSDWQLICNGESVSLFPSIGNWSFACRSHYWVDQNRAIEIPSGWNSRGRDRYDESKAGAAEEKHLSITDRLLATIKWVRWKQ